MSFFYKIIQILAHFFLAKKHHYKVIRNYLNNNYYDEIHDVSGADGELYDYINLNMKQKYYCYDVDKYLIQRGKKKFLGKKNIIFKNYGIEKIKVKNNSKKKLFVVVGVFHHINDEKIKLFIKKINNHHIVAFEPYYDIKLIINFIISKLDRGNFIRNKTEYKILFEKFTLINKANYYL